MERMMKQIFKNKCTTLIGSAVLSMSLFIGASAQAAVWIEKNQWNEDWENKYSAWVQEKVTTDMFININSPYFGIATDCLWCI